MSKQSEKASPGQQEGGPIVVQSMAVFLSYRREDTEKVVEMLGPRLRSDIGFDAIFHDTTSLEPGDKWRDQIRTAIEQCDTAIYFAGEGFAGPAGDGTFQMSEAGDALTSQSPGDVLREEVRLGLHLDGVRPIPVLVDTDKLPDGVPEEIKELFTEHQWIEVRSSELALADSRGYQQILIATWVSVQRKFPGSTLIVGEDNPEILIKAFVAHMKAAAPEQAQILSKLPRAAPC